jgi:GNAT superfamily N-acetyltransferase
MGVTVRDARLEDGPVLARMRWEMSAEDGAQVRGYDGYESEFLPFWRDAVDGGRWHVWIGEADGVAVSTIWVYRVPKVPRPHPEPRSYGYVTNVYTVPAYRNARIGSAVLARVVEWALEQDLEGLYVSPSERSLQFYERAGFTWSAQWMEKLHE